MTAHSTRAHATWSASATARNWVCAGAIAMESMAGDEQESIYAATGTACHAISERCLVQTIDPSALLGETVAVGKYKIVVDQEMVDGAEMYVDYVRGRTAPGVTRLIEAQFSLEKLEPPFDAGGIGDAVIYEPAKKHVEVIDLKYGRGVVEAEGNKQLRSYALGAILMFEDDGWKFDTVAVTIVQPRANHKSGRIRSETFHVSDLVLWTSELMEKMHRAARALEVFKTLDGNSVLLDEWSQTWLRAGNCTFCKALGFCPEARRGALKVAGESAAKWFEDTTDEPLILSNANALDDFERLAHILDGLDALEAWVKQIRAYAHGKAEAGVEIPGYQLVEKIGNRKWKGEAAAIEQALIAAGISHNEMFEAPELRSVSQMEKALGAKRKKLIEKLWERPVTGTNLVSVDKTTRPAAPSKAAGFFEQVS